MLASRRSGWSSSLAALVALTGLVACGGEPSSRPAGVLPPAVTGGSTASGGSGASDSGAGGSEPDAGGSGSGGRDGGGMATGGGGAGGTPRDGGGAPGADSAADGGDDASAPDTDAGADAAGPTADGGVACKRDGDCGNGLFCDGTERCIDGACVAGGDPCDDAIPCTTDTCDEAARKCAHAPDDSLCDDALQCDGKETCDLNAGCMPGEPPSCDDGRTCTVDYCDPSTDACVHAADDAPCDDGVFCNGAEHCSTAGPAPSGCVAAQAVECPPDAVACTVEACDEGTQQCQSSPRNALCTGGQLCVPSQGGCVTPPSCTQDAECDDGDACNGQETCNGTCQAGTPKVCDDGVACTLDSCSPATGNCVFTADHSKCGDGLACNGVEQCTATGCKPGTQVACDDGVDCTSDVCDEPGGSCRHVTDDAACSDGKLCNGAEVCTSTGCKAGAAYVCPSDGVDCTVEICDTGTDSCRSDAKDSLCPCGETCDAAKGCGTDCVVVTCQGQTAACGNCKDDDGDCVADSADPECTGPCDDDEGTYHSGRPGAASCQVECYFDGDATSGNDDCHFSHACDPHEVAPDFAPEGDSCAYDPAATIADFSGTCDDAQAAQSTTCTDVCGAVTPNGCDCFGCCALPGAPTTVWLGSEDALGDPTCDPAHAGDPTACRPCLQVSSCLNVCDHCELCVGKTSLPADCGGTQTCAGGAAPCGLPGQSGCPSGQACVTGCCLQAP